MRTVKSGFLEPLIFKPAPITGAKRLFPWICVIYFFHGISNSLFLEPILISLGCSTKSSFHRCYHYYCNENLVFNYHDNRPVTSPVSIIISFHGDKWLVFYILQLGGPGTSLFGLLCPVGLNLPGWHSQCVWVSEEGTQAPYVNACTCNKK